MSYSRYFSTATTQATGMPTTGVRIITTHSTVPRELLSPGERAAPGTSSRIQKTVTIPT